MLILVTIHSLLYNVAVLHRAQGNSWRVNSRQVNIIRVNNRQVNITRVNSNRAKQHPNLEQKTGLFKMSVESCGAHMTYM